MTDEWCAATCATPKPADGAARKSGHGGEPFKATSPCPPELCTKAGKSRTERVSDQWCAWLGLGLGFGLNLTLALTLTLTLTLILALALSLTLTRCDEILELHATALYRHRGDYASFLEAKQAVVAGHSR